MRCLCLAYGAQDGWSALIESEQDVLLAQDDVLRKRGARVAAVEPQVITVQAPDGAAESTDVPFAASQVPLAGFSVIEDNDIDEAIRLVANAPCPRVGGAIEVRPIMRLNDDALAPKD